MRITAVFCIVQMALCLPALALEEAPADVADNKKLLPMIMELNRQGEWEAAAKIATRIIQASTSTPEERSEAAYDIAYAYTRLSQSYAREARKYLPKGTGLPVAGWSLTR